MSDYKQQVGFSDGKNAGEWHGANSVELHKFPHKSVTDAILFNWVPLKDHEQARANIEGLIEQATKEARLDELLTTDDAIRLHGLEEYQRLLPNRIAELQAEGESK